jgi:hypothetical protein
VTGARVSQIGESCASTSDCAAELVCVPLRTGTGAGVCDLASYGQKPTGKVCGGECNTATDCCELPLGISLELPAGGVVAVHHCEDILARVLGGNTAICASAPAPSSPTGIGCFYYQTYCAPSCSANTWSCTANSCVYNAACTLNAANQLGGCPSLSRTNTGLVANCDTTANRCQIVTTGCNSDGECGDGQPVADVPGATCRGGDCTCHTKGCYLKCSQDLDCQQGFGCDPATKLCAKNPGCTVNAECVSRLQDVRAECKGGVCQVACKVDHDCSPSGAVPSLGAFNGTVCVEGRCQALGCASDSSCTTAVGLRSFCVAPAAPGAGPVLRSAITN